MIDVIGPLYEAGATVDGPPPVRLWGFHVNITADRLAERPDLEAKVHQPATLRRVWSGDDPASPSITVPLRFNGETAAREALGDLWPAEAV